MVIARETLDGEKIERMSVFLRTFICLSVKNGKI